MKFFKEERKVEKKKVFAASALAFAFILASTLVFAQGAPTVPTYNYNPFPYYGTDSAGFSPAQYYFGGLNSQSCASGQGQDFLVQILPGACSPSIIRSDLLEEQPVTVFCKLTGTKINPLIEVPQIKSISINSGGGQIPRGIRTVLFHPYRAALRSTDAFSELIGSPINSDLGYAVVVLNPVPIEADMPNSIQANLTANILYDVTTTFGITNDALVLPVLTDENWQRLYKNYNFWNGRAYVRASNVQQNSAQISVYVSPERAVSTVSLTKTGPASAPIYLPGSFCSSGIQVKLDDLVIPQDKAILTINNDKIETLRGMKLLDGRCTVSEIRPSDYGFGGSMRIACPEGTYTLNRPSSSAQLSGVNNPKSYSIGEIFTVGSGTSVKNYTVMFVGKYLLGSTGATPDESRIVIVREGVVKVDDVKRFNEKLNAEFSSESFFKGINDLPTLQTNLERIAGTGYNVIINSLNLAGNPVDVVSVKSLTQNTYSRVVENYYSTYTSTYQDIVNNYPNEKVVQGDDSADGAFYAEAALLQAAKTAKTIGKSLDELKILKELVEKYPQSKHATFAKQRISALYSSGDSTEATKLITTGGKSYYVTLDELSRPTSAEIGALLIVEGQQKVFGLKDLVAGGWIVDAIDEGSVTLTKVSGFAQGETTTSKKIALSQRDRISVGQGSAEVVVSQINFQKYAVVSVKPFSREGRTVANFTVNIGIEKRAIRLSPDQTKRLIGDLDRTIGQFEEITKKLGEIVENWKKVCLAGSAALWVESFLENLQSGGKAIARQFAMREADIDGYKGYANWCNDKNNWDEAGNANSFSTCIFNKKDDIDKIISNDENFVETWNKQLEDARKLPGVVKQSCTFGVLCKDVVNQTALMGALQQNTLNKYNLGDITSTRFNDTLSAAEAMAGVRNVSKLYSGSAIGFEEAKELDRQARHYQQCQSTGGLPKTSDFCKGIAEGLYKRLSGYNELAAAEQSRQASQSIFKELFNTNIGTLPYVGSGQTLSSPIIANRDIVDKSQYEGLTSSDNLALANLKITDTRTGNIAALGVYAIAVTGAQNQPTSKIYKLEKVGTKTTVQRVSSGNTNVILANIGSIVGSAKCNYVQSNPEIRYWGSGAYTGYPALIPLGRAPDGSYGWYAATKAYGDTINIGVSNTAAYQDSGQPTNFYIANVGPDGKADFGDTPSGDDQCSQYFALGSTYEGTSELGGMNNAQVKQFVIKAQSCMKQATSAAKGVRQGQVINTDCGPATVGAPKSPSPGTACEDFMSPEKCALLYNMCDPVICPTSRCDLGGRYPVDNVVQTGIIGSLALCAPNFGPITEGGVMVPVCLTGVHAGLDNLVSVLKDTRKCLQESLDTGRNVGICDQIKSVYMCEFFWREITPFIKTGVPQLIEKTIYQRKGGGEYLTFAETYQTSINQVQYFTNYYGQNALKAFQVRSTAEAGSLVCKAFVGLRYPNSANLFNELARPESPYQVNAYFDEIPYSSVTIPATSQYKVYWHIFAGRDEPAYWSVYLKEPAFVPTINIPDQYIIQSGYTAKGESVDITRDLTGPAGYKQLCVRVNLKEHCDFKKVTTGFAVNELTNLYVQSQTVPDYLIKSESECTSGASTLLNSGSLGEALIPAITNPGFGGLSESLQPSLYRRGIVRICSSNDPGAANNPGRWSVVGFCDNDRKIGCWLDTTSVKNAISDLNLSAETISDAQQLSKELLVNTSGYIGVDESQTRLKNLKESGDLKKVLDRINAIIKDQDEAKIESDISLILNGKTMVDLRNIASLSVSSRERAKALTHLTEVYKAIVLHLRSTPAPPAAATAADSSVVAGSSGAVQQADSKCRITSTEWNPRGIVLAGEEVAVNVVGNADCVGAKVNITISEYDPASPNDYVVSQLATFGQNRIAQIRWKTVWQGDTIIGGNPEFIAKSYLLYGPGRATTGKSSELEVTTGRIEYFYTVPEEIGLRELAASLQTNSEDLKKLNSKLQLSDTVPVKRGSVIIVRLDEVQKSKLTGDIRSRLGSYVTIFDKENTGGLLF